jgi:hypothetical protein
VSPRDFIAAKGVLVGEAPLRVDVLAEIAGVAFEEAWAKREKDRFGPASVDFISREHLIANKRATGRPRDLDDVRELSKDGF